MEQACTCKEERRRLRPGGGRDTQKWLLICRGNQLFLLWRLFWLRNGGGGSRILPSCRILLILAEIVNNGFIGPPNPPSVFL